ncbi:MAG: beta-hydroxyacyl-ACP dehydratase, partial [Planctomycetes bacterium RBG_16_64_10]
MRFTLIDRIVELEKGVRIQAVKTVSLSEEYLRDHFPRFPVLPGVFMLEAMTQASAWLIRATDDFAHSIVVLKEARNVKYADFVVPGRVLTVTAEMQGRGTRETKLLASGSVDGAAAVSARLTLEHFNLADNNPEDAATDVYVVREMRKLFAILHRPDQVPADP